MAEAAVLADVCPLSQDAVIPLCLDIQGLADEWAVGAVRWECMHHNRAVAAERGIERRRSPTDQRQPENSRK